jgi:hypothetical protein
MVDACAWFSEATETSYPPVTSVGEIQKAAVRWSASLFELVASALEPWRSLVDIECSELY